MCQGITSLDISNGNACLLQQANGRIKLKMFSWIDMDKFEMQLIEFQSSSIWKQKFIDLRVELEKIERRRLEKEHELLRDWNAIPEHIFMLKKTLQQHNSPCSLLHMLVKHCFQL